MITTAILVLAIAQGATGGQAASGVQGIDLTHVAPEVYIEGESYDVTVELLVSGEASAGVPSWLLTPAAFMFNGRALGKRDDDSVVYLEPGTFMTLRYDLSPAFERAENFVSKDFRLGFGVDRSVVPTEVTYFQAAQKGIDFMSLPVEQLVDYQVILRTSRGNIWVELWPDVAPNHVRNFLDLSYTGFYDGTEFHRVIPTFMIQGGKAKTGMNPPRTMQAEFSDRKHGPGVLSAARLGHDINSATSEFFIIHGTSPHLDGQYSAFGKAISGLDVVDKIAHAGNKAFRPDDRRASKPVVAQVIEKAIVVKTSRHQGPDGD